MFPCHGTSLRRGLLLRSIGPSLSGLELPAPLGETSCFTAKPRIEGDGAEAEAVAAAGAAAAFANASVLAMCISYIFFLLRVRMGWGRKATAVDALVI